MSILDHALLAELERLDCPSSREAARQLRRMAKQIEELHIQNRQLWLKSHSAKVIQFPRKPCQ